MIEAPILSAVLCGVDVSSADLFTFARIIQEANVSLPSQFESVAYVAPDGTTAEAHCAKPDAPVILTRLPGRRDWFVCPHCGRSDCWMFLAEHLKKQHGQTHEYLNRVGWKQLGILHDRLNNEAEAAKQAGKQMA